MNDKQASLPTTRMIGTPAAKTGDGSSQNYFIETIIRRFDEKRKNFFYQFTKSDQIHVCFRGNP
jgi:hypothetical protein